MDLPQAKCPHCGSLNPEDAFFCSECGGQTRSLVTGPDGPVADVDGDFEIKPLFPDQPEAAAGQPATPTPYQPAPYQPAPYQPAQPDPQTPGAGLTPPSPPPPPGVYPGSAPPEQQPYGAVSGPPPAYGQPGGYPTAPPYGYAMPPDGNTSGMGSGYPAPPDASGWTFAGCVPLGLFGFINGSVVWGVVWLAGLVVPMAQLVYMIYIGIQGKELAWRSRRFNSLLEYQDTMRAWNMWGLILGIVMGILMVVVMGLYFALFFALMAEGNF